MSKQIYYREDSRERLSKGIETLADAVRVTLGPKGRNVIISRMQGDPIITKDGVTVAKEISIHEESENMGVRLVKSVASKTDDVVGDGPQPLYSKVLTPTGFVEMGSLKVGDTICGTNGTTQQVLGVFPKGLKRICRLLFSSRCLVECSVDHIWQFVISQEGEEDFVGIKSLSYFIDYLQDGNITLKCLRSRIGSDMGYVNLKRIEISDEFTEMMCIKVSNDDHLYITDDYVVTHNTTTSIVLAHEMISKGIEALQDHSLNPTEIQKGMLAAMNKSVSFIKGMSIPVEGDARKLIEVATISANGDEELGKLIAETNLKVGTHGAITVSDSQGTETIVSFVEGMEFDKGYLSPYFVTNYEKQSAELNEPFILLYDGILSNVNDIRVVAEICIKQNRQLLVIANDVEGEALAVLLVNRAQGNLQSAAVKGPSFGDIRLNIMEDIAVITGGRVVTPDTGMQINNPENIEQIEEWLGVADRVVVRKDSTLITNGAGDREDVIARVKVLEGLLELAEEEYEKKNLRNRIAKLTGGVAVIQIGGYSDVEQSEKKDRIIDALSATKAAILEGIVPGGGVTLIRTKEYLQQNKPEGTPSFQKGWDIVESSLEYPLIQIVLNAGMENGDALRLVQTVYDAEEDFGYNAREEKFGSMYDMGIIDPAMVTRVTLENATSIASIFLTTECMIVDNKHNKDFIPLEN